MEGLRKDPFDQIAGYKVVSYRDFQKPEETGFPKTNAIYYTLENGWVCVRPSGTEPKIKYYVGVRCENEQAADAMLKEIREFFVK